MRDVETVGIALETAETGHFGFWHAAHQQRAHDRGSLDQPIPRGRTTANPLQPGGRLREGVVSQTLCKKKDGGRVAALEILMGSYALAANIREGKLQQIPNFIQMGRKEGMCSLNDSLLELSLERNVKNPRGVSNGPFCKAKNSSGAWAQSRIVVRPRVNRGPKKICWHRRRRGSGQHWKRQR